MKLRHGQTGKLTRTLRFLLPSLACVLGSRSTQVVILLPLS